MKGVSLLSHNSLWLNNGLRVSGVLASSAYLLFGVDGYFRLLGLVCGTRGPELTY